MPSGASGFFRRTTGSVPWRLRRSAPRCSRCKRLASERPPLWFFFFLGGSSSEAAGLPFTQACRCCRLRTPLGCLAGLFANQPHHSDVVAAGGGSARSPFSGGRGLPIQLRYHARKRASVLGSFSTLCLEGCGGRKTVRTLLAQTLLLFTLYSYTGLKTYCSLRKSRTNIRYVGLLRSPSVKSDHLQPRYMCFSSNRPTGRELNVYQPVTLLLCCSLSINGFR